MRPIILICLVVYAIPGGRDARAGTVSALISRGNVRLAGGSVELGLRLGSLVHPRNPTL